MDRVRKTLLPAVYLLPGMRTTRRTVLGAVATSGLAGCLGDDGDAGDGSTDETEGPTGTRTARETASPNAADEDTPTVQVRTHADLGEILAGPEGFTLYMFDQDTRGEGASSCHGGCADAWPPLTIEGEPTSGADVAAELETFERGDGALQVTANGWPLYYFASDESPGDAKGQGVNDVWWVLDPGGVPVTGAGTPTPTSRGTTEDDSAPVGY